jgi:hypothetical protein
MYYIECVLFCTKFATIANATDLCGAETVICVTVKAKKHPSNNEGLQKWLSLSLLRENTKHDEAL